MKYTTVLMDFDDTLCDFKQSEREAFYEVMGKFFTVTEEIYHYYHQINDGLWKKLERKEVTRPELMKIRFEKLFEKLNISAGATDYNKMYLEALSHRHPLMSGAAETCERIYKSGGKICIITNGEEAVQTRRIAESGLQKYVSETFISRRIGFDKPDVRFFDYVLKHVNEKDKSKIIVVGDSPSSDIEGGKAAGLDTCLIGERFCGATYYVSNIAAVADVLDCEKL